MGGINVLVAGETKRGKQISPLHRARGSEINSEPIARRPANYTNTANEKKKNGTKTDVGVNTSIIKSINQVAASESHVLLMASANARLQTHTTPYTMTLTRSTKFTCKLFCSIFSWSSNKCCWQCAIEICTQFWRVHKALQCNLPRPNLLSHNYFSSSSTWK